MFYVGVDFGQAADFTAISVVERIDAPIFKCKSCGATNFETRHNIRHLERTALHTSYSLVVDRVEEFLRSDELRGKTKLICDYTGCGRPIYDMMRSRLLEVVPVTIHGGLVTGHSDYPGGWNVSKRDLISTLQLIVEGHRIQYASGLPDVQVMMDELATYRMKVDPLTAHDSYSAREGEHDDLLLSVALACWYSEK
jgi:hypothetical protein